MKIYLKKNKEKPLRNRHSWIFSGAIARIEGESGDGTIAQVCDSGGTLLGYGYYSGRTDIAVRMLSWGERPVDRDYLAGLVRLAVVRRRSDPFLQGTNAFRLIYSEGDLLPGLVVDSYNNHLVMQILTMGMERLRDTMVDIILEEMRPESVYERSDHAGRSAEGLGEVCRTVFGTTPEDVEIQEDGVRFLVDVRHGQKTGFFLDQRENRRLVRGLAQGRKVLNLFSYTGGFTLAALYGGAAETVSVDASRGALDMLEKNLAINGREGASGLIEANVFDYLRGGEIAGDFIILDPPAFARDRHAVPRACRGYKEINLQVMKKCPAGSLLLTCSCSRFITMELFQKVLFGAALDAGRHAFILRKSLHPTDHPVSLYHPEGEYLKSILLRVE